MIARSDEGAEHEHPDPVDVPALEPERPRRLPKAPPPAVVPATQPVNPAPFFPPPVDPPVKSPVKGAILPNKQPPPPSAFAAFDEVHRPRFGHDRWGVPVNRRAEQRARQAAARRSSGLVEVSRPARGIAFGLLVGLMTAGGYGALSWALGAEQLAASIVIGLTVGWAMFRAWGRQSYGVALAAMVISALSFGLALLLVAAGSEAAHAPGDFWSWLVFIADNAGEWTQRRLADQPATLYLLAATVLAAFAVASGLGRRRVRTVYYAV